MSITLKEKMATFSPKFREEVYKFARELSVREKASQQSEDNANESATRPTKGAGVAASSKSSGLRPAK